MAQENKIAVSRFPVPELKDMPEDIRNRIIAVQEKSGFIPNVFLTLAHRPAARHVQVDAAEHVAVGVEQGLHQLDVPLGGRRIHVGGGATDDGFQDLGGRAAEGQGRAGPVVLDPGRPALDVEIGAETQRIQVAAEALPLATSDPVLLAIDSVAADGKDVSWLWDVDFEQLQGREVFATGPRAQDLAVRLAYAEVQHRVIPDLAAALAAAVPVQTSTPTPGSPAAPLDLIATYFAAQK